MENGDNSVHPINSFALVTYLPPPLGRFLDRLRCDLLPNCIPRAHVTILPPRPLEVPALEAWQEVCAKTRDLAAFEIEAAEVRVFGNTSVIYVALGRGRQELERLHNLLNAGALWCPENFEYHPHITVAQQIDPGQVEELFRQARERWEQYTGPRRFPADTLTFVQNTGENRWLDLAHQNLPVAVR